MNLNGTIISTRGKRLHSFTAVTASAGMDRATIYAAEQAAKEWAKLNGHKLVSDIVSQGEYRAWVEPRAVAKAGRGVVWAQGVAA